MSHLTSLIFSTKKTRDKYDELITNHNQLIKNKFTKKFCHVQIEF